MLRRPVPRYLVVDDSRAIRVVLADALAKAHPGATVVQAASGEEALAAYAKDRFDLVFLDLVMPGTLDGVAVLRRILEAEPRARVAVVTGLTDDAPEVIAALSEGACDYLRKPVSADAVRKILDRVARESGQAGSIR